MAVNWWLALIIIVVVNGIILWEWLMSTEPVSRKMRKWFFIVGNVIAVGLAVAELIWLDFE
ncbi:hypothetical protein [Paenibacillus cymbidii]|uniref:hypothetical protein n=1 Tax=Paenibacillus cymbidii TaxID=1639034 RepID=UPI001080F3E8|nr:hypothetical protein [Paenibacillus cymbidii]